MPGDTKPELLALRISPPRMTRRLVGALAVGVIVLLWWIATSGLGSEDRWISPVILPSPGEVIRSFPSLLKERALLQSIAATLKRVLVGFIFIACVPFVYSDAVAAVVGVPDRYVETAQTLGARSHQVVLKVLVTLALPDIYNSLRHLFGLAFGYIMLAELINAEHGLGFLLMASQRRGLSEHIILILIIIGLLAYGIDRVLFWFQRGLFPYRAVED